MHEHRPSITRRHIVETCPNELFNLPICAIPAAAAPILTEYEREILLFLAGQTGHDAQPQPGVGRFEAQTRRTFERIRMIVEAAGGPLDDLVTMTVFVTDVRFGDEFVRLRSEILKRDFPASALVGISQLANPGALIEIQAVATLD
jgi:2-iminobutanoate/2-iminopropanoate deaminase